MSEEVITYNDNSSRFIGRHQHLTY